MGESGVQSAGVKSLAHNHLPRKWYRLNADLSPRFTVFPAMSFLCYIHSVSPWMSSFPWRLPLLFWPLPYYDIRLSSLVASVCHVVLNLVIALPLCLFLKLQIWVSPSSFITSVQPGIANVQLKIVETWYKDYYISQYLSKCRRNTKKWNLTVDQMTHC